MGNIDEPSSLCQNLKAVQTLSSGTHNRLPCQRLRHRAGYHRYRHGHRHRPDRRGSSVYWDDNKMELNISRSIDKQKQIEHEHVNVTVYNGVVLLTGEVPDQRDIDSIIDLAKLHQGSRQVINRLELAGKTNMNSRANDGWITTKVKTAILTSAPVDSTRIKVVTERANVYLMGLVRPEEAQIAVEATRSVTGVVRVIKVFEYI